MSDDFATAIDWADALAEMKDLAESAEAKLAHLRDRVEVAERCLAECEHTLAASLSRLDHYRAALRKIGQGFSCACCRNLDACESALRGEGIDPAELRDDGDKSLTEAERQIVSEEYEKGVAEMAARDPNCTLCGALLHYGPCDTPGGT